MPIFEFKCQECGHKFDLMISNADKSKAKCPQCDAGNIKQLLSPFGAYRPQTAAVDNCHSCNMAGSGG